MANEKIITSEVLNSNNQNIKTYIDNKTNNKLDKTIADSYYQPKGNYVTTNTEQTIDGCKTFNAPVNIGSTEQFTTKFMTSNGGSISFGKEAANSGTMLRFDQVDGTCRLRFRGSGTPGAIVWEQPENGAALYFDLGNGNNRQRITMPTKQGTLALKSDIIKTESSTINGNIKINGTETQVYRLPGVATDNNYTNADKAAVDRIDDLAQKISTNETKINDLTQQQGQPGPQGEQGYGFITSVSRPSFTEANWNTYGTIGHSENWSSSSGIRNGCRIGDIFTIVGTATDTKNAHVLYYRCTTSTGDLRGTCIAHSIAERGAKGDTGNGCFINGEATNINFTSDPQTQINNINQSIPTIKVNGSTVNEIDFTLTDGVLNITAT